jgi:hypothetical protein
MPLQERQLGLKILLGLEEEFKAPVLLLVVVHRSVWCCRWCLYCQLLASGCLLLTACAT